MTTPQDIEQSRTECRKAFEFELIDNHMYVPSDMTRTGDYYEDEELQFAWECAWATWQSGRSGPAATGPWQQLEELQERVNRIGLDIDAALRGEVREHSPVASRLKVIAARCAPVSGNPTLTPPAEQWKCGKEFLPYHPSASHVEPAYRDGWNHCYEAAQALMPGKSASTASRAVCACGDEFAVDSYGAGFLDAKGKCFGCDAGDCATAASVELPEPDAVQLTGPPDAKQINEFYTADTVRRLLERKT